MFIKMEREQNGGADEDDAEEDKQAEPMVDPRTMSPDYQQIMTTPQPLPTYKNPDQMISPALPPLQQMGNGTNSQTNLDLAKNLHEIDTKKFLAEQINTDINKFRNADAFINAGVERMQAFGKVPAGVAGVGPVTATKMDEIAEDLPDRDDLDEVDDAQSSLSKELLLAKQNKPKQAFLTPGSHRTTKLEHSIGKQSVVDSDVDGLIKWAKDLPDDISVGAG